MPFITPEEILIHTLHDIVAYLKEPSRSRDAEWLATKALDALDYYNHEQDLWQVQILDAPN